jgi:hypothetical protein
MKYLFLLMTTFFFSSGLIAQCNCEKIKREDGTTVTQCPPLPVSFDNSTEIGLSVASNGNSNFLALTIRFKGTVKNVVGKITIRLEDNNMFSLELVNSQLAYIGNSQVTNAVYTLTETNSSLLKKSNIKTASFTMEDKLLHTYQIKMNADVVKKELNCL